MGFLIFTFGLVVGSFLNVLIIRLPARHIAISPYRYILFGRSKCPKCQTKVKWFDNIPLLSFFLLNGQCRSCRQPISWQYPAVELLTGLLFLFLFFLYGDNPAFLVYAFSLACIFLLVAFIDWKHFVILDSILIFGVAVFLIYSLFSVFVTSASCFIVSCSWINSLAGAGAFGGFFLSLFLITRKKGVGAGDINLAILVGLIFGLKNSVSVFFLAFLIGALWSIILLILKKAGWKSKIPFGSIMAGVSILFLLSGLSPFELIGEDLMLRLWPNQ